MDDAQVVLPLWIRGMVTYVYCAGIRLRLMYSGRVRWGGRMLRLED